jgi:hypothetical protein
MDTTNGVNLNQRKEKDYNNNDLDEDDYINNDLENELENEDIIVKREELINISENIYNTVVNYIDDNSISFGEYLDVNSIYNFLLENNI